MAKKEAKLISVRQMILPFCAALAATWLSPSNSTAAATYSRAAIGDWYGEGEPNSPQVKFLSHYGPDGTWTIQFRDCSSQPPLEQIESGTWSDASGKTTIITTSVNGAPAYYTDSYQTVSNDGQTRRYRLVESNSLRDVGFVFTAIRVNKDFALPDCRLTS